MQYYSIKIFDADGKEIWDTHYNEWNSNVGYRKDSQNVVLSAGRLMDIGFMTGINPPENMFSLFLL